MLEGVDIDSLLASFRVPVQTFASRIIASERAAKLTQAPRAAAANATLGVDNACYGEKCLSISAQALPRRWRCSLRFRSSLHTSRCRFATSTFFCRTSSFLRWRATPRLCGCCCRGAQPCAVALCRSHNGLKASNQCHRNQPSPKLEMYEPRQAPYRFGRGRVWFG